MIFTTVAPVTLFFGGLIYEISSGISAEIDIDSYRLCKDKDGKDIIIIKYLLKNEGKEPTALFYEGDFCTYQNGIGLTEYVDELPPDCNYDPEDQYKNIKSGKEYYAEIAYLLESLENDVEVEVNDYGFFDRKKGKVFRIN